MEKKEGFYKENKYFDEDLKEEIIVWEYAPNFVFAPDFTLLKEEKDSYKYPVFGWTWYDEQPFKIINDNENNS